MEVADQIVVMNDGRVEQIGTPRELYSHPANGFVMGFVGPVTNIGGRFVRPHDIDIQLEPVPGGVEAMVERVAHLGFEVKVELALGDGQRVWAQTTVTAQDELELHEGQIVYIRAGAESPIPA